MEPLLNIRLQAVLAASAIWLAWETWRLRVQDKERTRQADKQFSDQAGRGDKQLSLLRKQVRLSLMPPLELGPCTYEMYRKFLQEKYPEASQGNERSNWATRAVRGNDNARFILLVSNSSDRFAQNLVAMFYDADSKEFYWSDDGAEQLGKETRPFMFFGPPVTAEQIKTGLTFQYGDRSSYFHMFVESKDEASFVGLFFLDLDGRMYMKRRRFFVRRADVNKVAGELFYQE